MSVRHFEIRAPRTDITGTHAGILFVEGVARVSFDDTRDEFGECHADQPVVQVGRTAVLFAQRAADRGYELIETDKHGKPLNPVEEPAKKPARTGKVA